MEMLTEIEKLPVADRLQLVDAIWESITRDSEAVPVPEWQRAVIRDRYQEYLQNPKAGVSWEEVKASLRTPRTP